MKVQNEFILTMVLVVKIIIHLWEWRLGGNTKLLGCLLVLFMVSFAVQKLLSFIRSHLFICVFISISLGAGSKRILL